VGPEEEEKEKKVLRPELPSSEVYRERAAGLLSKSLLVLLVIFTTGNVSCLTIFFLNGFGVTSLSDQALCALAAATVAEVAGLMTIIIKVLSRA
jgi:hypothetical protein